METLRIDESVEREQRETLARVLDRRDQASVDRTLTALVSAAEGGSNTMPCILDAVRAYATVGEICDSLKPVFGEYREVSVF